MDSPMEYLKENQATLDAAPSTAIVSTDEAAAAQQEKKAVRSTWPAWFNAFKQVLPVYILLHLAFLILTYLSALFIIGNFSPRTLRISTLWLAWFRWDSGHFTAIASNGYDAAWRTACGGDAASSNGTDPLLISTSLPDLHIQTTSPAKNRFSGKG